MSPMYQWGITDNCNLLLCHLVKKNSFQRLAGLMTSRATLLTLAPVLGHCCISLHLSSSCSLCCQLIAVSLSFCLFHKREKRGSDWLGGCLQNRQTCWSASTSEPPGKTVALNYFPCPFQLAVVQADHTWEITKKKKTRKKKEKAAQA